MKRLCIPLVLAASLASFDAHAYRLPPYAIADADRAIPAEEVLARCRAQRERIGSPATLARIEAHRVNRKLRLTRAEREGAAGAESIETAIDFWQRVVDLKGSLAALHGEPPPAGAAAEAEEISRIVIERLYALSQRFRIVGSALLQNFLINRGIRKEGFCYHYVDDLYGALAPVPWSHFDLHWGSAWSGTYRENNALVITAKGMPFSSGIAVDAWRAAGKPFWTPVEGDRFPWVETIDVVVEK